MKEHYAIITGSMLVEIETCQKQNFYSGHQDCKNQSISDDYYYLFYFIVLKF